MMQDPFAPSSFFNIMTIIFPLFFFTILGVIIWSIAKSVRHSMWNKRQPVLIVEARIVAKRTEVWSGSGDSSASTRYHVTFEVQSGDRMELMMTGEQYGLLAEGDFGKLTFQGTMYLDFMRI